MSIDYAKKVQGTIMADLNAGVPLQKAAQVRLDNLPQICNRSQFVNSPDWVDCLEQCLTLRRSLGRASAIADQEAAADLGIKKDKLLPDIKKCDGNAQSWRDDKEEVYDEACKGHAH